MEEQRVYFIKSSAFNKFIGILMVILSILIGILAISLYIQTRAFWPLSLITLSIPIVSGAVKKLRKIEGYTNDEGIFYSDKKVGWSNIISVFFNSQTYVIKSKTGETMEIDGSFYLLNEELDKRLDQVPNKGLLSSPIRRWAARGKEYFGTGLEDRVMGTIDKYGSFKVPDYLVIIIVVVSLILIFTVNIWMNAIFKINLMK